MKQLKPDATGIYVAAHQASAAIEEAIEAEVPLIVAVAEHIPIHNIMRASISWFTPQGFSSKLNRYTLCYKHNLYHGLLEPILLESSPPLESVELGFNHFHVSYLDVLELSPNQEH